MVCVHSMCAHSGMCRAGKPYCAVQLQSLCRIHKQTETAGYENKTTCQEAQQPSSNWPIPRLKKNVTERSNIQLFAQHLPSTCFPTGTASVLMSRFRSQWRKQHRGWPPVSVKSRDWLKRSTVRTWLRTAIHGTRDSTSRADMKKKYIW